MPTIQACKAGLITCALVSWQKIGQGCFACALIYVCSEPCQQEDFRTFVALAMSKLQRRLKGQISLLAHDLSISSPKLAIS